jgi:hypothetical protein
MPRSGFDFVQEKGKPVPVISRNMQGLRGPSLNKLGIAVHLHTSGAQATPEPMCDLQESLTPDLLGSSPDTVALRSGHGSPLWKGASKSVKLGSESLRQMEPQRLQGTVRWRIYTAGHYKDPSRE